MNMTGQLAGQPNPAMQAFWNVQAQIPEIAATPIPTPRAETSQYNLLNQLTGGNIGQSPLLQAGAQAFQQYTQPIIQNQAALAGMGRSGGLTEATALGLSQMMTPLIQQEISNRVASVSLLGQMAQAETQRYMAPTQQTLSALQASSTSMLQAAQQGLSQQMQQIQAAYQAGQIQEAKATQLSAAAYADYQRLYNLAQSASVGMVSSFVPGTIGQTQQSTNQPNYAAMAASLAAAGIIAASSRDAKQALELVDPFEVLNQIRTIPIGTWEYKADPGVRHIGPMADDFKEGFGVGTDQAIAVVDAMGILIASVQALAVKVEWLTDRLGRLEGTHDSAPK